MALSGTLETFSLPDVLRLLASTKKTGLLALDGDRGAGRIWVDEGGIVAASAERAVVDEVDGVLFELLRFREARFEFEPGAEPLSPADEARAVEDALDAAEARLVEWHDIETVVPSLDVWVRMVPERDGDVTVTPAEWQILATVGTGTSGHRLAAALEQGEFDVCRQLRDLIDAGMVELDEAPADAAFDGPALGIATQPGDDSEEAPVDEALVDEPVFAEPALSTHEVSSLGANLASFVAAGTPDEPVDHDEVPAPEEPPAFEATVDDHDESILTADDPDPVDELDEADVTEVAEVAEIDDADADADAGVDVEAVADADDAEDFLSQLSHLSPKAAAAIEATSSADERGEDAPTGADAASGDENIDQSLLLRFLSSAKQ